METGGYKFCQHGSMLDILDRVILGKTLSSEIPDHEVSKALTVFS